uniref:Uncharacterized protein n=1 Tax=Rhizophora mucronata TaxID=61149 RepID=A0A2P2PG50_RHIMU
MKWLPILAG